MKDSVVVGLRCLLFCRKLFKREKIVTENLKKTTMKYIKRRTTKMRKVLKKELKKIVEKIAIKSATTEANATCPWVSYQPEIPEAAKKLRKH